MGSAVRPKVVKKIHVVAVCTTLLVAAIVFWPTLYRYEKVGEGKYSTLVRINRLTGHTEQFNRIGGEWVARRKQSIEGERIPPEEQTSIIGNASLGHGFFEGKIYNGSRWRISEITFRVKAKNKDGSVRWDRKFKDSVYINPFSTSDFIIEVTGQEGVGSFDWYIEDVVGVRVER